MQQIGSHLRSTSYGRLAAACLGRTVLASTSAQQDAAGGKANLPTFDYVPRLILQLKS